MKKFDVVSAFASSFKNLSSENNLHRASRCGDTDTLVKILDGNFPLFALFDERDDGDDVTSNDVTIDARNRCGRTCLWLAASEGHVNCVKILIGRGSCLEASDVKGQTPLFAAVKSNQLEAAKILLQSGADPDGSIENLSSPLHVAIRENFVEMVKLLVDYGANVDGRDVGVGQMRNVRPLHMCLVYDNFECFKTIIKAGADLRVHGNQKSDQQVFTTLIKYATHIKYAKLFVTCGGLLENRCDVTKENLSHVSATGDRSRCLGYLRRQLENPLKLTQLCRIKIRSVLGRKRLKNISEFTFLPSFMRDYLLLNSGEWK